MIKSLNELVENAKQLGPAAIAVIEAHDPDVLESLSQAEPLDEVAGGAARFVDPLSAESIAKGISDVLGNRQLRDKLVKDGIERAAMFSWEKTAADTLKAISGHLGKRVGQ